MVDQNTKNTEAIMNELNTKVSLGIIKRERKRSHENYELIDKSKKNQGDIDMIVKLS